MSNVLSAPLEVKPGVRRSVHYTEGSTRGRWVVHIDGKSTAVMGQIIGDRFYPDDKYRDVVTKYKPKRNRFYHGKPKIVRFNLPNVKRLSQECHERRQKVLHNFKNHRVVIDGKVRRIRNVAYGMVDVIYRGVTYRGVLDRGNLVVKDVMTDGGIPIYHIGDAIPYYIET